MGAVAAKLCSTNRIANDVQCYTDIKYFRYNEHLKYLNNPIFECIGWGRHRVTFRPQGKGIVIKVAHCSDGVQANDDEVKLFRYSRTSNFPSCLETIPVARCRKLDTYSIVMEYVIPLTVEEVRKRYASVPGWVYSVDGWQVGLTKSGRLVAYDYSII